MLPAASAVTLPPNGSEAIGTLLEASRTVLSNFEIRVVPLGCGFTCQVPSRSDSTVAICALTRHTIVSSVVRGALGQARSAARAPPLRHHRQRGATPADRARR